MMNKVAVCFFLLFTDAVLAEERAQTNKSQTFDPNEARMFASLSSVTYCESTKKVLDWTCGACAESKTRLVPGKIKIIDAGDLDATRILVGRLRDQSGCVVAFRGSSNLWNWIRDLQYNPVSPTTFEDCEGCMVHSGFYDTWKNVRDHVVDGLKEIGCGSNDAPLYVTGHSLGAALTHLAMFHFSNVGFKVAKAYSYEAPRVGNKAFSKAFSERFERKFPVYRITHAQDPVVHLPPTLFGFSHVQTEVHYDSRGKYKVCSGAEDDSCADMYWNIPVMIVDHAGDHCASPLVPNGQICSPRGCARASESSEIVV